MKSEKEELIRMRYLYKLKYNKISLGFSNDLMDFKKSYQKNKEEWKKKVYAK